MLAQVKLFLQMNVRMHLVLIMLMTSLAIKQQLSGQTMPTKLCYSSDDLEKSGVVEMKVQQIPAYISETTNSIQ